MSNRERTVAKGSGARRNDRGDQLEVAYLKLAKLKSGATINQRYRLNRLIGKGGFGTVFEAFDITLGTKVAVKFLNPELTREEKKFLRVRREINVARKISDERIIKVFSLESWRGIHFLVMELVGGRSLKSILEQKSHWIWVEFKAIFLDILEAVAVLHGNGIVHRDLKPANILIDDKKRIKILDFGLAKEVVDVEKTSTVGEIIGSPYYMSPEQIRGTAVGYASDVYQLGLILYRVLTSRHPFESSSTMEMISKQLIQKPDPPTPKRGSLPRFLFLGIEKALEKEPARRFRDAGAMVHFFRKEKISWPARILLALNRRPLKAALAAGVLLSILFCFYRLTFASRDVNRLVPRDHVLEARNIVGRRLWSHDFAPFHVYTAYTTTSAEPLQLGSDISSEYLSLDLGKDPVVIVLLAPPPGLVFPAEASIASEALMCRLAVLRENGKLLREDALLKSYDYDDYDYIRVIKPTSFQHLGKNPHGETCVAFTVQQYQSMYPSALVYMEGIKQFVYTHPGTFKTSWLKREGRKVFFLLDGINNLFSHMRFMGECAFDTGDRANSLIRGIPSLRPEKRSNVPRQDKLFILPIRMRMLENRWREEGRARLVEDRVGDILDLDRTGRLRLDSASGPVEYHDSEETLRRLYTLVNIGFQERQLKHNPKNALELIVQADSMPVQNPYLRSAVLYLRGDLEIHLGNYSAGRESLRRALEFDPGNNDACERICELEMLRGDIDAALRQLSDSHSHSHQFWGFTTYGVPLFKGYLFLHSGRFNLAEAEFAKLFLSTKEVEKFCLATADFFQGGYKAALTKLTDLESSPLGYVDLRELRLLAGRTLLLESLQEEKAAFLFEDLCNNSLDFGHLAEMSNWYFLARSGRTVEAAQSARATFKRLQEKARGDFMTRLWLFYDAYVYGRIMEMAGEKEPARQGFLAGIAANPHTRLSRLSREHLENNSGWKQSGSDSDEKTR